MNPYQAYNPNSISGPGPSPSYSHSQQQPHPTAQHVNIVTPPDVAMLAHQGYLAQQQQIAALNSGRQPQPPYPSVPGGGGGGGVPGIPIQQQQAQAQSQIHAQLQQAQLQKAQQQQLQQFQQAQQAHLAQQQAQAQAQAQGQGQPAPVPPKKKRGRPSAASQNLARQAASIQPPPSTDQYIKNAMAPPPPLPQSQPHHPSPHQHQHHQAHAMPVHTTNPNGVEVEPWADGLDDIDSRELAMNRYRVRHEILADVFGPESIKDIPDEPYDPWAGLGLDGESLEAKVLALEKSNEELEERSQVEIEEFRARLQGIDSGMATAAIVA